MAKEKESAFVKEVRRLRNNKYFKEMTKELFCHKERARLKPRKFNMEKFKLGARMAADWLAQNS